MDLKTFLSNEKTMTILKKFMITEEQASLLEYCNTFTTCTNCKYKIETKNTPCKGITVLQQINNSLADNLANMSDEDIEEFLRIFNQDIKPNNTNAK